MLAAKYIAISAAVAILTELARQIGAGNVPIPPDFQWVVPIAGAGIAAIGAGLRKLGEQQS